MTAGIVGIGARKPQRAMPILPFDRGVLLADLALVATIGAVVALFAISPQTLEAFGISYITSGGGVLAKVHPATPLALVALALRCLASRHPARTALRLATADPGVVLMVGAVVITFGYALAFAHTPITPMIDTFLLPVLVFLLLRDLDPALARPLALAVGLVLCANAVIALAEFLQHFHLIQIDVPAGATSDPTRGDATFDWRAQLANDWRATALIGHPLTNGLVTGAFALALAAPGSAWIPAAVKVPVALLQVVAMLAFGARTSLVLMGIGLVWLGTQKFLALLRAGRRLEPRPVAFVLLAVALAVVAVMSLSASGLADHTIERFQNDQGSATTRITMLGLFTPLSWSDILLGPDPAQLATLQRLEGLEFGIESSWIGLALMYGMVVTATLLLGLAAFMRSVLRACGPGAALILGYFVILASVAATMSTKTTVFALTVALVMLFLRQDAERPMGSPVRAGAA